MASGGTPSSTANTSAFEFDEIESNDEFDYNTDINFAISPDLFGIDDAIGRDDNAFLATLQVIDPELVKIYNHLYGTEFFWLRLPQPSIGTACLWISSVGSRRLM